MGRNKKTLTEYSMEYHGALLALIQGVPMRQIAAEYHIGLSTVQRLKKKFF